MNDVRAGSAFKCWSTAGQADRQSASASSLTDAGPRDRRASIPRRSRVGEGGEGAIEEEANR